MIANPGASPYAARKGLRRSAEPGEERHSGAIAGMTPQVAVSTSTMIHIMTNTPRSILVVDDEPDIRDSVADILNDFGYEADTARDGAEALVKLGERFYDVALLDFKMPGMDGLALCRAMQELCPETSAILVSAYTGDGVAEEAIRSGIQKVIAKPVDMTEVIKEVDHQLDRPIALVIDDDSEFCASIRDVLDEWGFRVSLAGDEASASRLLNSRHPQVVVLDIVLGGDSDATRVLQTIRESHPETGVVLITGHRTETAPLIDKLLSNGAASVCYKPLKMQRLLDVLRSVTRRKNGQASVADH